MNSSIPHPVSSALGAASASPTAAGAPDTVSIAHLYRQMWLHAAGARAWLVFSSVLLVSSQLVKLLVPWLAAQAIDILQKSADGHATPADCLPWVGAIVGVSMLCWMLHGPGRVIERSVALRVRRSLTDRLYARLLEAPLGWHGNHHSAELAHRASQATHALSNFTQSQFIYLQNAVNLVGPLVALALLSGWTGSVALGGLLAVALTIIAFDRAVMRLARIENDAERRYGAAMFDCLGNILTVLSFRLQGSTRRLLARRLDDVVEPLKRSITLTEWKWCAVDLLSVLLSWGLVALYAWRARSTGDALMLGGVFMVYQYAQQSGGVIGSLASNLQNFARMRTDFASAAPIWSAPRASGPAETSTTPESGPAASVGAGSPGGWRHIDLCDLAFEHPAPAIAGDERRAGLRSVSLRLHAGERIALVGPSGSGKSTLLRLMAGLIQPSHGHVEIDGIAPFGLRDLRHCSTLIPQEAQVFEATLRENIAFDIAHADADITEAVRIAQLDDVIGALPLGLETPIAQGGANLSGGQRQRMCLARGLLAARGSSVLMLDEPTSALDPITEAAFYERLDLALPRVCLVASVHRLSLLSRFDRVVLIDRGQIVDVGTAEELQTRQRLFRQMLGAEREPAVALESTAAVP